MEGLSNEANGLLERLRKALEDVAPQGRFAIAYSGGLDSRFLSHASKLFGFTPTLLHVTGSHVGGNEEEGYRWARENGFEIRTLELDPLNVPEVHDGTKYRCYGCKKTVFTALLKEAGDLPLCDGTNHTDGEAGVWRPGMIALKELGIHAPLAAANLGKPEIHRLAAETGMERPDQLPEPCLLTRFPYGMTPTEPVLQRLKKAEEAIRKALEAEGMGAMTYRLRIVSEGHPEIHFDLATWTHLTDREKSVIRDAVVKTDPEFFANISLRGLEKLSGYFDRVTGIV